MFDPDDDTPEVDDPAAGRAEADLDSLIGLTVTAVERGGEEGDWAVIQLSGGAALYVDAPTLYIPAPAPYTPPPWKAPYRARLEDRHGDRWSITASTPDAAAAIADAQRARIVWVRKETS